MCMLTLCGLLPLSAHQTAIFKHFYDKSKPIISIYDIAEDKSGFIWVTYNNSIGVYRFDGEEYISLSDLTGDASCSKLRGRIYVDARNRLWITSEQRIVLYDCASNRKLELPKGLAELNEVNKVMFVGDQTAYIQARSGIYRCDVTTDSVRKLGSTWGHLVGCDKRSLWLVSDERLFEYDLKSKSRRSLNFKGADSEALVRAVNEHELLVGSVQIGLALYDKKRDKTRQLVENDIVRWIEPVGDSLYFAATELGVHIYNSSDGTMGLLKRDFNDPYGLNDNAIYDIFEDSKGGVWLGSYFKGLSYLPKRKFEYHYVNPSLSNESEHGSVVRQMMEDDRGCIWIATEDGGLHVFDPRSGQVEEVKGLVDPNIHGLVLYGGKVWAGTLKSGIYVLDQRTHRVVKRITTKSGMGLADNFVLSFLLASDGKLYLGTKNCVQMYDAMTNKFVTVLAASGANYAIQLLEDQKGDVWVVAQGLFRRRAGQTEFISVEVPNSNGVRKPNYLCENGDGTMWLATPFGLYEKHVEGDSCEFIYHDLHDDVSFSESVYTMAEDLYGNMWLATAEGIVRYSPSTGTKYIFSLLDAPTSHHFNRCSVLKTRDGSRIYNGTLNGLIYFEPKEAYAELAESSVMINRLSYYSQDSAAVLTKYHDFSLVEDLEFAHNENDLTIGFNALNYGASYHYTYAYLLEGDMNQWVSTDNDVLRLHGLPPGKYDLRVKAMNEYGAFGGETSMVFTILPPWYRSDWAYMCYTMLFIFLFILLFYWFNKRLEDKRKRFEDELESEKEKALYRSKLNFFANIVHEIRTPLTLIKGPLERIYMNPTGDNVVQNVEIAVRHTQWLTNLCTELLDYRKIDSVEAKGLSVTLVDINRVLRQLVDEFKDSIEQHGGVIELDMEVDGLEMVEMDVDVFQKIMGNLLLNTLKYSDKFVRVELRRDGCDLCLSVLNDGSLLELGDEDKVFKRYERKHTRQVGNGIGLSFARDLAKRHGWDLRLLFDREGLNHFQIRMCGVKEQSFVSENYVQTLGEVEVKPMVRRESQDSNAVVLLVEDNIELRNYMQGVLSAYYRVVVAGNGVEALEVLECERVSLIVTDVMMPEMDGIALCQRVKGNDLLHDIPVVMLTADTSISSKLEALRCSAEDYIEKPFSESYLVARIDNILSMRRKLYEKFVRNPLSVLPSKKQDGDVQSEFLDKITAIVEREMTNDVLSADYLASELAMSKATVYRKLKSVVDMSTTDFILFCRLKKASALLAEKKYMVSEVSYMTGFSTPAYFSKCFAKQFGQSPKQFVAAL